MSYFKIFRNGNVDTLNANKVDSKTINAGTVDLNNTVTMGTLPPNPITSSPTGYILNFPGYLPTENQFLSATTVSGTEVDLAWANAGGGGGSGSIPQVITVYKGTPVAGQSYNTLTEAVAYISTQSPGVNNRYTILVQAGTYTEPDTVTIPSYVTVNGDFGLSVVIKTAGTGHILHVSNRCDVYNITVQGPTSSGKAGIFIDDTDIGIFMGNCRIVGCDIGLLVQPSAGKTCYYYVRNCLFNSNVTSQVIVDGTLSGARIEGFSWNNVYYATSSGISPDTYGPLMLIKGNDAFVRSYSGDFERDFDNITGTGIQLVLGGKIVLESPVFNWLNKAVLVPSDSGIETLVVNAPYFNQCNTQIELDDSLTLGSLSGTTDFSKVIVPIDTPWYITGQNRRIITVGISGENNFSNLLSAISYISSLSPPPSATNKFTISIQPGIYTVNNTVLIPDYVDLQGVDYTQTTLTISVPNTDLIHAGYNCTIRNISLYGYGTNADASNLYTVTGSTGYGVLYEGSTSFTDIGYMESVRLANFQYQIGAITSTSPVLYNILQLSDLRFLGYVNTETCIKIYAGGVTAVSVNGSRFSPTLVNGLPGIFQSFCSMDGVVNQINSNGFNNISCRNGGTVDGTPSGTPLQFGTAFYVVQGSITIRNSVIQQYNIGFRVPNSSAVPTGTAVGCVFQTCATDGLIENPSATGSIQSIGELGKFTSYSPNIAISVVDSSGLGTINSGSFFQSQNSLINGSSQPSNISPQFNQASSCGLITGGVLTVTQTLGVYYANNTAGSGYVMVGTFPTDQLTYVTFSAQTIALLTASVNYVYIDSSGTLRTSASVQSNTTTILLGYIVAQSSGSPLMI